MFPELPCSLGAGKTCPDVLQEEAEILHAKRMEFVELWESLVKKIVALWIMQTNGNLEEQSPEDTDAKASEKQDLQQSDVDFGKILRQHKTELKTIQGDLKSLCTTFLKNVNEYTEDTKILCLIYQMTFWIPERVQLNFFKVLDTTSVRVGRSETVIFADTVISFNGVRREPPTLVIQDIFHVKRGTSISGLRNKTDEDVNQMMDINQNDKDNILNQRRRDRAVEEVGQKMSQWATERDLDALILTMYKYKSYLHNTKFKVTATNGDHNILCIIRQIGVVFIQVTSSISPNFGNVSKRVKDAQSEVTRDKFVFQESNRDLPFILNMIPMYGFVAAPFQSFEDGFPFCDNHLATIISQSLLHDPSFGGWLSEALPTSTCMNQEQYNLLCSRYVGPASITTREES